MYISKSWSYTTPNFFISAPEYLEREHTVELIYALYNVIDLGSSDNFENVKHIASEECREAIKEYNHVWNIYDNGDMSVGIPGSTAVLAAKSDLTELQLEKIRLIFQEYNDFETHIVNLMELAYYE